MQAQRQEAGIIKELEGSKCEELGSISKNWPQRTKRGGGGHGCGRREQVKPSELN